MKIKSVVLIIFATISLFLVGCNSCSNEGYVKNLEDTRYSTSFIGSPIFRSDPTLISSRGELLAWVGNSFRSFWDPDGTNATFIENNLAKYDDAFFTSSQIIFIPLNGSSSIWYCIRNITYQDNTLIINVSANTPRLVTDDYVGHLGIIEITKISPNTNIVVNQVVVRNNNSKR